MPPEPSTPRRFKEGARVKLPDGRPAIVTTRRDGDGQLMVIVRPIKGE
jgi:hypothetical protein